jgi:hypothetical protein
MCFCYFYCCIKALTKAAPKSRRIIGATLQLPADSFFFFVIFIHSVSSLCSDTVILFFPHPLYLYTTFLYYFLFSSTLMEATLLQVLGSDHVNKNRRKLNTEEIHINVFV